MKILYGIQGTGHGHISRAREILPLLGDVAEVDVLMSGYNCRMQLCGFNVIRKYGLSFVYDSGGGVSLLATASNLHPFQFFRDISSLHLDSYDMVISDFEPVTAWAAHLRGVQCVGMSHQSAFLSDKSPRPTNRSQFAEQILRHFAPCTKPIGFHFKRYDTFIEPPVIRSEVLELLPSEGTHVTVYLPAFDPVFLSDILKKVASVEWEIFSPGLDELIEDGPVRIRPIDNTQFLRSLESCRGVLTSAGFETCAESMYLGKKLIIVPIKNQYEQGCNAAALSDMGVPVLDSFNNDAGERLKEWIENGPVIPLPEIADSHALTGQLLSGHWSGIKPQGL